MARAADDATATNDATAEATRCAGAADVRQGAGGVSGMADEVRNIGVYHGFGGGNSSVLVVQPAVVLHVVRRGGGAGVLRIWTDIDEATIRGAGT